MLSEASLRPLLLTFRWSFIAHIVPFYWNFEQRRLILSEHNEKAGWWKFQGIFCIFSRISLCFYFFGCSILAEDWSMPELLMTILFISIWGLTTPLHYFYITRYRGIVRHFNSLVFVNDLSQELLRGTVEIPSIDGLERSNRIMGILSVASCMSSFIGPDYAIQHHLPMFRFLNFGDEHRVISLLGGLLIAYLLTVDWALGGMEMYIMFLNPNATALWQLKLRQVWDIGQKETCNILRCAFQMHHKIYLDTHIEMIGLFLSGGQLYMVLNSFALIRYHDSFHVFTAMAFVTFTLYSTKGEQMNVCLNAKLREASCNSGGTELFWNPPRYVEIHRRGRPLEVKIGNSVTLTHSTFLAIVHEIVLNFTINLLLTF